MADGHVERDVASEAIDGALPPMPRLKAHLRTLPCQEVAVALAAADASAAPLASKPCVRCLILTAVRSGEAQGATWDEIHEDAREWGISGKYQRIPRRIVSILINILEGRDGRG